MSIKGGNGKELTITIENNWIHLDIHDPLLDITKRFTCIISTFERELARVKELTNKT